MIIENPQLVFCKYRSLYTAYSLAQQQGWRLNLVVQAREKEKNERMKDGRYDATNP